MFNTFRRFFPGSTLVRDVDRVCALISAGKLNEAEAVMRRPAIRWGSYRVISAAVMDAEDNSAHEWYARIRCSLWPRPYEIVRGMLTRNYRYLNIVVYPYSRGERALNHCVYMFAMMDSYNGVTRYLDNHIRDSPGSWLIPLRVKVSPGRVETLPICSPRDNRHFDEWRKDPSLEFGWLLSQVMLRYVTTVRRELSKKE